MSCSLLQPSLASQAPVLTSHILDWPLTQKTFPSALAARTLGSTLLGAGLKPFLQYRSLSPWRALCMRDLCHESPESNCWKDGAMWFHPYRVYNRNRSSLFFILSKMIPKNRGKQSQKLCLWPSCDSASISNLPRESGFESVRTNYWSCCSLH